MKAYNDLRRISPKTINSRAELIIKESTNSDGTTTATRTAFALSIKKTTYSKAPTTITGSTILQTIPTALLKATGLTIAL